MRYFILCIFIFSIFIFVSCTNCTTSNKNDVIKTNDSIMIEDSLSLKDSLSDEYDSLTRDDSLRLEELQKASVVSPHGELPKTEMNNNYFMDKNGISVIKIGAKITELPDNFEGLYDNKKIVSNGLGGKLCLIYYKKEQIFEVDYDNKTNIINSIRITSPSIKTEDGICQFMDYNSILRIDKVRQIIAGKNNVYNFVLNGVRYELEENIKGNKYVSAIVVGK